MLVGHEFDYEIESNGFALCSKTELVDAMDGNWSSAQYVGTLYYPGNTVTTEVNSNLYDLDEGFKAVLDAKTEARAQEIETLADVEKCIVSHLDSRTVTNVYYTVENGQVVRHSDINVIYDSEATTVIYTKVELETTAIGLIDPDAVQPKSGQRYNLMGQPVSKGYKGVVIEDGKKVLVK